MSLFMSDEQQQRPSQSADSGAQTWSAPPGFAVYGASTGAEPPDYERPWDPRLLQQQQAPPADQVSQPLYEPSPNPPGPSPHQQQPGVYHAYEQHSAPAPQSPDNDYAAQWSAWMPSPIGPAYTPEDRRQFLSGQGSSQAQAAPPHDPQSS